MYVQNGAIMIVHIFCLSFFDTVCSWTNLSLNYTVYEVTAFNNRERAFLYKMHVKSDHLIFLNSITNKAATPMIILVKGSHVPWFEQMLHNGEIEYAKINKDSVLEQFKAFADTYYIDQNYAHDDSPKLNERFLDYKHILTWVENILKKYTGLAGKIVLGETFEKREIFVLKISTGVDRPAVFIVGGEQGRDWISTAVLLNFINSILLTQPHELTEIYDLYIMPVNNPDGYEYSMKHDRFWNKNRHLFFPQILCQKKDNSFTTANAVGVNVDRNFFLYSTTYVPYSECDSIYTGHKTVTESESKALAKILSTIATRMMAYINVRGFGKLITIPYAERYQYANNYAVMMEMLLHASGIVDAKYKVSYKLCSTGECLYNHSGNSPDWVKSNMNVPIVYTMFLNHHDTFLPRINQVFNLTQHFSIIIKETLILANSIYGPLFNGVFKLCSSSLLVVAISVVIILFIK